VIWTKPAQDVRDKINRALARIAGDIEQADD